MERRCENCEYFSEYVSERTAIYDGCCCAHPPQCKWDEKDECVVSFNPEVTLEDWCGEFKPREESDAKEGKE